MTTAFTRERAEKHPIPPLENGDQLDREEFERRYAAMPEVKKAELIEGVVYMPSPVRADLHGAPHFDLIQWLGNFRMLTPGIQGVDNATLRLDKKNEPQPDAMLYLPVACCGKAKLSKDGYLTGAPELVCEIAASSRSIDLGHKKNAYLRNGIQEYLIWRVQDEAIDWFHFRDDEYIRWQPDVQGVLRSGVFPGLWLDVPAMLAGDLKKVFETLQQGVATKEHEELVGAAR
jgi:Uma2 family endonuclease